MMHRLTNAHRERLSPTPRKPHSDNRDLERRQALQLNRRPVSLHTTRIISAQSQGRARSHGQNHTCKDAHHLHAPAQLVRQVWPYVAWLERARAGIPRERAL